jgi:hypothetical protein
MSGKGATLSLERLSVDAVGLRSLKTILAQSRHENPNLGVWNGKNKILVYGVREEQSAAVRALLQAAGITVLD